MPATPQTYMPQKADANNPSGGVPLLSDCIQNVALVANTAKVVTVPTGAGAVVIAGNVDYALQSGSNGSLAFPTGDVAAGSGAVLNPTARWFPSSVTALTFVSTVDGVLSLEWYK